MSRPLVVYHGQTCADGFASAWVAHMVLGDRADYLPVQYGEEPPDVTDRDMFVLDFCYKRPVMLKVIAKARSVVVLDHHKTAAVELAGDLSVVAGASVRAPHVVFDVSKSGARLTWDYFFAGQPSPWLVDYVEDRDLWRWRLDGSREVSAAIASYPFDFALWDSWYEDGSMMLPVLVDEGRAILRYQQRQVDSICQTAREVELDGHRVLVANTPVLISEVAGKLAENRPFGAAWFVRGDGLKQWSLRSREGGVDVSEIARKHGGGGHRNSAGYEETL